MYSIILYGLYFVLVSQNTLKSDLKKVLDSSEPNQSSLLAIITRLLIKTSKLQHLAHVFIFLNGQLLARDDAGVKTPVGSV